MSSSLEKAEVHQRLEITANKKGPRWNIMNSPMVAFNINLQVLC